jgi:NAD(P)-dependent dehydrogenase (short-subunit alcohol dehydrogenase family)
VTSRPETHLEPSFSLVGKVAVVVGASGAIGRALSRALGAAGASLALLARQHDRLEELATELQRDGTEANAWPCDALNTAGLAGVRDEIQARLGAIDILVNAAGGNVRNATLADHSLPFDLELGAYREVLDLNLFATLSAINVFGRALTAGPADDRAILNISSMAADRAMSRVGGYGAAKAAVESITRWLAVELGRRQVNVRVNAIAPGFFIGQQNRDLLLQPDGSLTERGQTIIAKTPLHRFGDPADLASTAVWLCSPGARFVTGVVVPVDGGFSAFSGV